MARAVWRWVKRTSSWRREVPSGTVILRGASNESWIVVAACLRQRGAHSCGMAVRELSGSCAGAVRKSCGSCAGAVRELCGSCAEKLRELCGKAAGAVRNSCGVCVGKMPDGGGWAGYVTGLLLWQKHVRGGSGEWCSIEGQFCIIRRYCGITGRKSPNTPVGNPRPPPRGGRAPVRCGGACAQARKRSGSGAGAERERSALARG